MEDNKDKINSFLPTVKPLYANDWSDVVRRGLPTPPGISFTPPIGSLNGVKCQSCPAVTYCDGNHCTRRP